MVDPNVITKFDRTHDELMEFWLFSLFVRGKNADVQARKLQQFLDVAGGVGVLKYLTDSTIDTMLRQVKAGQYNSLTKAISATTEAIANNADFLKSASALELEAIPGVGPKTARFFILHSRPKARVAVLDTHIINYLNDRHSTNYPRTTPASSARYAELEDAFLFDADFYGVDPAAFDLAIWRASRETYPMDWHRYYTEVS